MRRLEVSGICFVIICLFGGCILAPWQAWRYEHDYEFDYPAPWQMPSVERHSQIYVDGALVNVRVMAHDETTRTGSPPYGFIVPILTRNREHISATFHSVRIVSSLEKRHIVKPIEVDRRARKTTELEFPVTLQLEPYSRKMEPVSERSRGYLTASLWADESLFFEPESGEEITIRIDVEVHKKETSTRKVVEYVFQPKNEGGLIQGIYV